MLRILPKYVVDRLKGPVIGGGLEPQRLVMALNGMQDCPMPEDIRIHAQLGIGDMVDIVDAEEITMYIEILFYVRVRIESAGGKHGRNDQGKADFTLMQQIEKPAHTNHRGQEHRPGKNLPHEIGACMWLSDIEGKTHDSYKKNWIEQIPSGIGLRSIADYPAEAS